jgi:hypothetical protein
MNILFDSAVTDEIRDKYILLPLDTFYFTSADRTETAYCLIENVPILNMMSVEKDIELHNLLIERYKQQDWDSCQTTIDQLLGRWEGELDTFYNEILDRLNSGKVEQENWTPTVVKD